VKNTPVNAERFRNLPKEQVARLVRAAGPKVCVFPVNGTRRWFMLEHHPQNEQELTSAYIDAMERRQIELCRLLFDHGLDILLMPIFGLDLLKRGDGYMHMMAEGLARLATHPDFIDFYIGYGVRVHFYGDYRQHFAPTPFAYLSDLFDRITAQTSCHDRNRLFFGVCADDASETLAESAVRYYIQHGRAPDKRTLVEMYYGEYVPPVDLFIGFDKFCAFDMPLVATGNEDLYFTVSPSAYLTERQLRDILYDHLYTRPGDEADYLDMQPEDWALMQDFYHANLERTLGVGAKQTRGGYWYPLPAVQLPDGFGETGTEGV
jgi:tuberculosinol/isotuberculosinol synthase